MSAKPLLIVESPSKARTIEKYLGGEYTVKASVGHVKDLPKKEFGIDLENDFKSTWTVLPDKRSFFKELKQAAREAGTVYIATDPDREGEAIAAHIAAEISDLNPHRVRFNEITPQAIKEALNASTTVDENLVEAQMARRLVDRMVGYQVSPKLWRTLGKNIVWVKGSLSAGRVQSTTLRLVVERERERMRFRKANYFDMEAQLATGAHETFKATLSRVDDQKIADGKDFDSKTGMLKSNKALHLDKQAADTLKTEIESGPWEVKEKDTKPKTVNPKPPYTTSTLQQDGVRRFGSAKKVMRLAQTLYESGFISYMRTDSTTLSAEALSGARTLIQETFGSKYLPAKAHQYKTKVKNAQEAHEAIRPAGSRFAEVATVSAALGSDAAKLYEMIWRRTVASQMTSAKKLQTQLEIHSGRARFKANGEVLQFDGFLKVYGRKNGKSEEAQLPDVKIGDVLDCQSLDVLSHETKPPARYTEASLVKEMENIGIGRPSTYASTIDKLFEKSYIQRQKGALVPSYHGIAVTQLLENHFAPIIDFKFTARMESDLDEIASGHQGYVPFLSNFWQGDKKEAGLENLLENYIDVGKACTVPLANDDGITLNIGHYGPYLAQGNKTKSIPFDLPLGDLTPEKAMELLDDSAEDEPLGTDPESGEAVFLKSGRYGPYLELAESKKRRSLPKSVNPEDVDLTEALKWLSLPRELGLHPETGEPVLADFGRYGPYIRCGKQNAKILAPTTPLDITLDQAVELLKKRRKSSVALREIGKHPDTGDVLTLKDGRYGPYVTDGTINASLPKDESPDTITLERCVELIEKRKAAPPKKRRKARRK